MRLNCCSAVSIVGKEAVAENQSLPLDDDNDTLLFEKLQEHVLAHYPNPERKGCPDPAVLEEFDRRSRQCNASRSQRSAYFQVRGMHAPADGTEAKEETARSLRVEAILSIFRIDPPPLLLQC
jgi:hypothetical protein